MSTIVRPALRGVFARRSLPSVSPLANFPGSRRLYGVQVSSSGEKVTHTGQETWASENIVQLQFHLLLAEAFDADDYRKVRFVARQKEVNEQFAIDLIKEQPVSEVDSRVVSCDGGGGALGHPKVFINLDKDTKTGTCGYCGLQFKKHPHH
ncbi:NADH dehydrogenase [ubiquinone] iron-sulfur protein 6, mitochondrial isoform X1 [Pleurodeles waltl]|uniref:NADH dehydrogenase [ubiquinone] iron-sulfur protein 6, mitochondrial isoform X1 n=1 Tax=Pleurodeles waltl TaxID=8319 RepID=UPI0037093AA1